MLELRIARHAADSLPDRPAHNDSRYPQLSERVSRINETFPPNIAKDDRISPIFEGTGIILFHKRLTDQFYVLVGGPLHLRRQ